MRVLLAGYNVDSAVLEELKKSAPPRNDVTPETLSAAYARISRDPRPVDELRAAARAEVERARRSNEAIIFKMGHHSVAEHAVFNFDVIGLSRLAIEELERFRLLSFTEKSQRYITLGDDFVVPAEVRRAGLRDLFVGTVEAQNALYHRLYARLKPHVFAKHRDLAADPRNHAVLDGWAKEDARYIVSLATEGQLGLTLNARSLELVIRRFAAKGLEEVRELNRRLHELAKAVAPSIILFTEASPFDAETYDDIAAAAAAWPAPAAGGGKRGPVKEVVLAGAPPDGDTRVLAALLHATGRGPYAECLARAAAAGPAARKDLFKRAFARLQFYDFPLREFEHADLVYDLVVSASCFAQLKRHRMATLTWQRYDPGLGATVPPSVLEIGAEKEFSEVVERTGEVHAVLEKAVGPAADYVLTNAHRRRALLKLNVRELYHVSRLREDASAQWEIRRVVGEMTRLARKALPLAGLLLGGKDVFPEAYRRVFGRTPRMVPPALFK
ncbi:MAG TPA: FAD-dependent thymidylate synthase [Candidatus Aminicenantes bacterium]|nr:FAD-dependent thymidylate synthase [Candidatus Aminicenantes bacterium]